MEFPRSCLGFHVDAARDLGYFSPEVTQGRGDMIASANRLLRSPVCGDSFPAPNTDEEAWETRRVPLTS